MDRMEEGFVGTEKSIETKVDPKHNFMGKLLQPEVLPYLKDYIKWQAEVRENPDPSRIAMPNSSPISINLDPTSACNYSCGHCVDMDILNSLKGYDFGKLKDSLSLMNERGLKSVIVIGGGEPTMYRNFTDLIKFIKGKDMQVAVVSNGTGMYKINEVGDQFSEKDWVRLSLDSATEETFQEMHRPKGKMAGLEGVRQGITLENICQNVEDVKSNHPNLNMGFSYIVTWPEARTNGLEITPNMREIVPATRLAKESGFDYLSLKAFLDRTEEGNRAEIVGIDSSSNNYDEVMGGIRNSISEARQFGDESFKVLVSPNLQALLDGTQENYKKQPRECHMTNVRNVLGIRGLGNCPVYRESDEARIGSQTAYSSEEDYIETRKSTAKNIKEFDASVNCKDVVCMYQPANQEIERLINEEITNPGSIDQLQPGKDLNDYFL